MKTIFKVTQSSRKCVFVKYANILRFSSHTRKLRDQKIGGNVDN